jgi:hypothetical protein
VGDGASVAGFGWFRRRVSLLVVLGLPDVCAANSAGLRARVVGRVDDVGSRRTWCGVRYVDASP